MFKEGLGGGVEGQFNIPKIPKKVEKPEDRSGEEEIERKRQIIERAKRTRNPLIRCEIGAIGSFLELSESDKRELLAGFPNFNRERAERLRTMIPYSLQEEIERTARELMGR